MEVKDTSCAVVLSNRAKYSMESTFENVYVRKTYLRKIKINSQVGLKYACVTIPYYRFMEYSESVGGIKVTIDSGELGEDGKPAVRKMDREHILDVRIDLNKREKRFVVPDVKPGDIIEIKYVVLGHFPEYYVRKYDDPDHSNFFTAFGFVTQYGTGEEIVFPKWNFQEDIPVEESTLEVSHFDDYRFDYVLSGKGNVVCEAEEGIVYRIMQRSFTPRKDYFMKSKPGSGASSGFYRDKYLKKLKFTASRLLPIKDDGERNVINPQKYRASVDFDFKGRKIDINPAAEIIAHVGIYNYSDSWTDVNKILLNSRYFGRKIEFSENCYKDYADSVKRLKISEYEKVQMICNHIRNDIECVSSNGAMFIRDFKDVFAERSGSNVEICAIAYRALKDAGFNVRMILLKSRDAGYLYNGGISVGTLNNTVLYITMQNRSQVLFDPTGNPHDTRILNPMHLVKDGIVYGGGEERLNLMNIIKNKEYHNATIYVEANGMVNGTCKSTFTNHSAYEMVGKAPLVKAEEGHVRYGTLDSLQSKYTREFDFRRTSSVIVDDKIFINPFAEIYFEAEHFAGPRNLPIEFSYPKTVEYTATIHIPHGYEVYDLPQNNSWQLYRCGAKATILAKSQGEIIQFGITIQLQNATIPLEQYKSFQEWWQQMCSIFDEMIILRKKGDRSFTDTEKMTA